ncbi:MAG TPA: alpha/beta hydrolase [Acidimicrobiales bacterium]|nr:alpha/beta hydrolase [Acidimicrobiales bacterium]
MVLSVEPPPSADRGPHEERHERDVPGGPPLPMGRRIALAGRGTTFVREVPGPAGAAGDASSPTVLLLHGWIASGGLNWFQAFGPLGARYRVLALDHRGHGRGIRSRRRFTLADCADDAAALIDQLGAGPVVAVGYSLGGPVAQLLWKRHPDLVAGLVLAATSHHLVPGRREQMVFSSAMAAAAGSTRLGQMALRVPNRHLRNRQAAAPPGRPDSLRDWARAEMARHDPRAILEAGVALANYRGSWIDRIDVPTGVLVTTRDRAVDPRSQVRMAERIPGATIHRIDDGHVACASRRFGPVLRRTVDAVVGRIHPTA